MVGKYVLPPLLVHFLQLDVYVFLILYVPCKLMVRCEIQANSLQTKRPGALLHLDVLAKFALKDRFLALETHRELLLEDLDDKIFRTSSLWDANCDVDLTKLLFPCEGEG